MNDLKSKYLTQWYFQSFILKSSYLLNNNFFISKMNNPYLIQNDQYNFIFIHIPKNAGISIQNTLFPNYPHVGHHYLLKYKIYNKLKFENYFKFAFFRSPWDRLASAFYFVKNGGVNGSEIYLQEWSKYNLKSIISFEDFVLSLKDKKFARKVFSLLHFKPQYLWLYDESKILYVDYLGTIDNLYNDISYVVKKLNLMQVPYIKGSSQESVHELSP